MSIKQARLSQPVVLTMFINPFVHLLITSLMMIIIGRYQIFTFPFAEKKIISPLKTEATLPPQKKEKHLKTIILETSQRYQVDPAIIKAIIKAESGFDPKAVSDKGARGLMQLMPCTAKYLGVKDSLNPEHNIDGGVRYFKTLLDRFDCDVELALAAYNAGICNVRKYDGVPPFNATKFFIKKVLTYYETYKNDSKDLSARYCQNVPL